MVTPNAAPPGAPSKSQVAYDWIRDRIVGQEYGPGYRLVFSTLASDLGMSVVPVREALRRLEAEGLVTHERNVGARVSLVDESAYSEVMQTLGVVEGAATALSAPLLTPADLDAARAVNDRMTLLADDLDPRTFTSLNQEFHSALYRACPNAYLLEEVHRGWARLSGLRTSTFAFVPGRAAESVREHAQILDLVAHGADPLEIELAARRHRWATLDAYLTLRRPDRAPQRNPASKETP
ncbi:GntR family transcriptional regulator [Luteimicrobium sp. NPDC057192]|uniref:GntR family transcriptional regulator n=1 Tax=Luteimicrobium sp. NPDC057192 TaxID=3346042 RepID=UPI00364352E8